MFALPDENLDLTLPYQLAKVSLDSLRELFSSYLRKFSLFPVPVEGDRPMMKIVPTPSLKLFVCHDSGGNFDPISFEFELNSIACKTSESLSLWDCQPSRNETQLFTV